MRMPSSGEVKGVQLRWQRNSSGFRVDIDFLQIREATFLDESPLDCVLFVYTNSEIPL